MTETISTVITQILDRQDLSAQQMQAALGEVMGGRCSETEIAALLTALRMKGEAVSEVEGAARAMRQRATRIVTARSGLLDTCGTGGDGLQTFNISTAAAIVAAAAGVPVAKHGNRSVSSSSGSADVLEALGVNIQLTPEQVGRCLDELGLGFCFAPLLHRAMKYAAPVRKQLGFRTIFNLLGPLTNPADAAYQLVGANDPSTAGKLAHALSGLGRKRALVVCGAGQLDEVSLWGETAVFLVDEGRVTTHTWTASRFDLSSCRAEHLQVKSAQESAAVIRAILDGEPGPRRDIVLANAAAALMAARRVDDPAEGVRLAVETVDSGAASALLQQLIEFTNS